MPNKKNALVKRAYVKRSARLGKVKKQDYLPPSPGEELVNFILKGVDLLNTNDKAKVFAYILGKQELNEHRMWAITQILKD